MGQGSDQGRDPKKRLARDLIPSWLGILGLTFVILLVTLCAVLLIRAFLLD
jgi:hypothetical protein